MRNIRVLISGASIAGPALAYWLDGYGFEVTVVEKSPELRRAGQAVDFKGATHLGVLERMGILGDLKRVQSPSGADGVVVNSKGRPIAKIPAEFSGGELEVARGDLSRILFERTEASCTYMFADSIASLNQTPEGVEVAFERAAPREFDLVVGADGIHSNVRRLAFGSEADFVQYLGYYYALADLTGEAVREDLMYNEPGRMAATGGTKSPAFFVFASKPLNLGRDDVVLQKQSLMSAFAGSAWNVPQLMEEIPSAQGFYMDSISRVRTDQYSKGRVVLVGDSAYGNALGGFGAGLAIVGAYVLAGELARAKGDYHTAFSRYETQFRPYAKVSYQINAGKILAPSSRMGIFVRNKLFSIALLFKGIMKMTDYFATDIDLVDYKNLQ